MPERILLMKQVEGNSLPVLTGHDVQQQEPLFFLATLSYHACS